MITVQSLAGDEQGAAVARVPGVVAAPGSGDEVDFEIRKDRSHPKGELKRDEGALTGALREVEEETGHRRSPGTRLPTTHHFVSGRAEQVSYRASEATDGHFTRNREVDRILRPGPPPPAAPASPASPGPQPGTDRRVSLAMLRRACPSAAPAPQTPPAVCPCASVRARLRARRAGPRQPQLHLATQNWPCSTVVVRCCCGGIGSS
ncbi:NUDIX domain-containing protein [Streptomyces europaeiscabiei]|uniref:NUDIX domain-containing protein n=1 Tax=Streptomyces europaeiscabiei TaxID=146819 RepID=UPI0038B46F00